MAQHITQHTMATISSTQIETAIPTAGPLALAIINGEITRQALFIAYLDDFKLMMWVTLVILPLLFFMKRGSKKDDTPLVHTD